MGFCLLRACSVLAPCLLGRDGTGRHDPASPSSAGSARALDVKQQVRHCAWFGRGTGRLGNQTAGPLVDAIVYYRE